MKRALVLASRSPSRRRLVSTLGVPFEIMASNVSEVFDADWTADLAVVELARRKALAVCQTVLRPNSVIVGCDTEVALGNDVLGKPDSSETARLVLGRLRGRMHRVLTGTAVIDTTSGAAATGLATALVVMRSYSDEEIDRYVASGEPMDHAGSYAFQGLGRTLVARYSGDVDTIEGISLALLVELMASIGLSLGDVA